MKDTHVKLENLLNVLGKLLKTFLIYLEKAVSMRTSTPKVV